MAARVEVSPALLVWDPPQVCLSRPGPGSWGLRLQGGVDIQKALCIINVTDGSPSETSGLKVMRGG